MGRHEVVAIGVFFDFFQGLAGLRHHDFVELPLNAQDFAGFNFNISGLTTALCPAEGLVNHDPGVGESEAFALGSGSEEEGSHGGGQPDADRHHFRLDVLHRVEDGEASGDGTTGGVNVQVDRLARIFGIQIEHDRDDLVRDTVVDAATEEDDSLPVQAIVDVDPVRIGLTGHLIGDSRNTNGHDNSEE